MLYDVVSIHNSMSWYCIKLLEQEPQQRLPNVGQSTSFGTEKYKSVDFCLIPFVPLCIALTIFLLLNDFCF